MVVALTTVTEVAETPPKVTPAPVWKFVPVIVTAWPPAGAPVAGATELMVTRGPFRGVMLAKRPVESLLKDPPSLTANSITSPRDSDRRRVNACGALYEVTVVL